MLAAELGGKFRSELLADPDRFEDTLTSAVFGALQYLPRDQLLLPLLRATFPALAWAAEDVREADFEFWPRFDEETEPDVVIRAGSRLVVVEAKFGSGFGRAQLRREWDGAARKADARGRTTVLLWAVTAVWGDEPAELAALRADLRANGTADAAAKIVHSTWHGIGKAIEAAQGDLDRAAGALARDVLRVMEKRGVRQVFEGIPEEDYWLVASAQRVARKRLYPAISTLGRELRTSLAAHGVGWGVSEDKVVHYHSMSMSYPGSWARSYLQLPFWPNGWPKDRRGKWWATFYCTFDFLHGDVAVGYMIRPESQSVARTAWEPKLAELTQILTRLPKPYLVTVNHGNYARVTEQRPAAEATVPALRNHLLTRNFHLCVERRLAISAITSAAQVHDMILEDVDLVRRNPLLLSIAAGVEPGTPLQDAVATTVPVGDVEVEDADVVDDQDAGLGPKGG